MMEDKTADFLEWCIMHGCDPARLPSSMCHCGHDFEKHRFDRFACPCLHFDDIDGHCECDAFFPGPR